MIMGRHPATSCYRSSNTVAPDITYDFPLLHFLPHTVCHLCYDGVVHEHGGQAPGREDRAWTLSQWWIKRLLCCANGTV